MRYYESYVTFVKQNVEHEIYSFNLHEKLKRKKKEERVFEATQECCFEAEITIAFISNLQHN